MKRNQLKNVKRISSFQYENIFDVHRNSDGMYYYNLYNTVHIDDNIAKGLYTEHEFSVGDYWTKLANKYYGDPDLWWIIVIANQIKNPFKLPEPGTKLKILKDFVVSDVLNQIINGSGS